MTHVGHVAAATNNGISLLLPVPHIPELQEYPEYARERGAVTP
jgi:hypothetical protein